MRIREKPLAQNDNVKALTAGAYYCDISTATVRHTVAHCTVRFAQDSSLRYSFTLVSPFLHYFSLWLCVGAPVEDRLLGMTGGREVAVGDRRIPTYIPLT